MNCKTFAKSVTLVAVLLSGLGTIVPGHAQSTYRPTIPIDDALYQSLGGDSGLVR